MSITIRAWNFRGLSHLSWSPAGVCLLSGPNGSGKSTTLAALAFCRNALLRGVPEAIRFAGGATALRNRRAAKDADVVFEIVSNELTWRIEIPIEGEGVSPHYGERLTLGDTVLLDVPRRAASYTLAGKLRPRSDRSEIHTLLAIAPDERLQAFHDTVRAIRIYDDFDVYRAHKPLSEDSDDDYLHPTGRNLVPVLRSWKSAPRQHMGQFQWVLDHVKRAFPDLIEDLEFTSDGRAWFYPPGVSDPDAKIPLYLAASGLVTALLQLTAVAGARDGSLIGFDEMENQLHPHAIRILIAAMREMAEARDLTIVLTTHAPVVMNAFKGEEEHFFILEAGPNKPVPVVLTEARDPDWLAHFALGDLYEREEFASQRSALP